MTISSPKEPPPPYLATERAAHTSRVFVRTPPDLHEYPSDSEKDNPTSDGIDEVPRVGRNGRAYVVRPGPHPSSLSRAKPDGKHFYVVTK
ncbi:hypothetical protein H0H92_002190, partial [Tricholoma furcatifolium]